LASSVTSATFSASSLKQVLQDQLSVEQNCSVYLAFSGGLDSHVLLHALSRLADDYPFSLNAIHVNHSLNIQSANWADHCMGICDELGVPLTIKTLILAYDQGQSLEAVARDARYSALAEVLPDKAICMTAQHMNDQTETVMLQLLRGAGVHGLAAMPASKVFASGRLVRPLLGYSRDDLHAYASKHRLTWVEDPSNQDNRFDRNFLRNEVLPVLRQRWPGMDKSMSRSARHAASAATMLDEMGLSDLQYCKATGNQFFPPGIAVLRADLLANLAPAHQLNALRCWVRMYGIEVPGDERLQSVRKLLDESSVKGAVLWQHGAFRLYNNLLWLCDSPEVVLPANEIFNWDPESPLPILKQHLELRASRLPGQGIAVSAINGFELQVRFRQGGESCRMPGQHGSKALKKLLQDLAVPPWLRASLPLIYLQNDLIAVSSLWSNPHYLPAADDEGYIFSIHYSSSA
jgi:tRNA(Ile)-lysidine synthase